MWFISLSVPQNKKIKNKKNGKSLAGTKRDCSISSTSGDFRFL